VVGIRVGLRDEVGFRNVTREQCGDRAGSETNQCAGDHVAEVVHLTVEARDGDNDGDQRRD
jgi:hypothetical protein